VLFPHLRIPETIKAYDFELIIFQSTIRFTPLFKVMILSIEERATSAISDFSIMLQKYKLFASKQWYCLLANNNISIEAIIFKIIE